MMTTNTLVKNLIGVNKVKVNNASFKTELN